MTANNFYQKEISRRMQSFSFSVSSVVSSSPCPPYKALKRLKQSKFAHPGGKNYPKQPISA